MKALRLWPTRRPMGKGLDKTQLLEKFTAMGFFLIDTCDVPVDKLASKERKTTITRGAARVVSRVRELEPESIVIVKKTVFAPVRDVLEKAGLGESVLNTRPLPFPSHGNQRKYRTMLRRLISKKERIEKRIRVGEQV
jgi:hypothetical protein